METFKKNRWLSRRRVAGGGATRWFFCDIIAKIAQKKKMEGRGKISMSLFRHRRQFEQKKKTTRYTKKKHCTKHTWLRYTINQFRSKKKLSIGWTMIFHDTYDRSASAPQCGPTGDSKVPVGGKASCGESTDANVRYKNLRHEPKGDGMESWETTDRPDTALEVRKLPWKTKQNKKTRAKAPKIYALRVAQWENRSKTNKEAFTSSKPSGLNPRFFLAKGLSKVVCAMSLLKPPCGRFSSGPGSPSGSRGNSTLNNRQKKKNTENTKLKVYRNVYPS